MSHTNVTPNFDLPQFTADDKPDWLVDINDAFQKIDTGMASTQSEAESASSVAQNAESTAENAAETASQASSDVEALRDTVTSQGGTINTITSLIGNGAPTTTDKTLIGGINELHADQGDLANLQTTAKSSLVAAINEAVAGGGDTQTVRYDSSNDRFEVLLNGVWVPSIRAYANNLVLFDGSAFSAAYENGVYASDPNLTVAGFTINLPSVVGENITTGGTERTLVFTNPIDLSEYSALVVETSGGNLTVDLTNVNQNGYVFIYKILNINNENFVICGVSSAKANFHQNRLADNQITGTSAAGDTYITNIRLVK